MKPEKPLLKAGVLPADFTYATQIEEIGFYRAVAKERTPSEIAKIMINEYSTNLPGARHEQEEKKRILRHKWTFR